MKKLKDILDPDAPAQPDPYPDQNPATSAAPSQIQPISGGGQLGPGSMTDPTATLGGVYKPPSSPLQQPYTGGQLGPGSMTDYTAPPGQPVNTPNTQVLNPTGPAPTLQSSGPSTGHWANFDQYFNANAQDIRDRGMDTAKKASDTGATAVKSVEDLGKTFNQQSDAGTPTYENFNVQASGSPSAAPTSSSTPSTTGTSSNALTGTPQKPAANTTPATTTGTTKQALDGTPQTPGSSASPTTYTPDQAAAKAASATYTGPTSLADVQGYIDTQQKVQDATATGNALGTSSYQDANGNIINPANGLQALLSQYFGPTTQQGGAMDAALLGGGNRPLFDAVGGGLKGLDQYLANADTTAQNYALNNAKDASAISAGYTDGANNPAVTPSTPEQEADAKWSQDRQKPDSSLDDYDKNSGQSFDIWNQIANTFNGSGRHNDGVDLVKDASLNFDMPNPDDTHDPKNGQAETERRNKMTNDPDYAAKMKDLQNRGYQSLTQKELDWLRASTTSDQDATNFWRARLKQIQGGTVPGIKPVEGI